MKSLKNILKTVSLIILIVTITGITWSKAQAYAYGYTWSGSSATYKYDASLPGSYWYSTDYGANRWTNVSTSSWTWTYNSYSSNYVAWVVIDGSLGIAGLTTKTIAGGHITWFKIEYDNQDNWYTGDGSPGSNQVDMRSIAAHEFGHALGMSHTQSSHCPGGSSDATMCSPYVLGTSYLRSLENDDKSGVSAAYP